MATIRAASHERASPDWFRFEVVDEKTHYAQLAAKRRDAPIEITSPLPSLTEPVVTAFRYADVARIISDESEFSSDIVAARYRPVLGRRTMVALDWHERRPIRSVLGSVFGRRNANRLVADVILPVIEPIAHGLRGRAEADLVAEVASVVPSMVIAKLIGLPPDAAPALLQHALAMMSYIDAPKSAIRGSRALRKLFTELIDERRGDPGDDLVSRLVQADGESERLTDEDVVDLLILLAFAGTETAFPGIGSMFAALLQHPDQLEMVRSAPALTGNAVDEALRWEAPVQATFRSATRDTRLGDLPVPAGTTVLAHLGSANHDVPGLDRADRFEVDRPGPIQHLSFGLGARRCIGMHLARLEMRLTLEHVLAACPRLRPVSRDDVKITGQFVRGPVRLLVETS